MNRFAADALRFVAIAGVLIIHATGSSEKEFLRSHQYISNHFGFTESFLAVVFNQIARFSVPLFMMLSGYGLSKKYGVTSNHFLKLRMADISSFYLNRMFKIGLPYLIWSTVFAFALSKFPPYTNDLFQYAGEVGKITASMLFFGTADYHFYFFSIILQCYLLFPLLIRVPKLSILVVLFIAQVLLTSPSQHLFAYFNVSFPILPNSLFIFWIFYFYAGIYFAADEDRLRAMINKIPAVYIIGLTLILFGLILFEYIFRSHHNATPGYYNHFNRQSVVLYSISVWIFFVRYDDSIQKFLSRHSRGAHILSQGAALSFFVYIFHVWPLRFLESHGFSTMPLMTAALLMIVSFGMAYALHRLLPGGMFRWIRLCLGLPETPQSRGSHIHRRGDD